MSLLTDILRTGGGTALGGLLGNVIPGVGADVGRQFGGIVQAAYTPPSMGAPPAPGGTGAGGTMPVMASLPRILAGTAAAGVLAGRGVATIARSAATYCRRNPAWCAQIGGTAAIAAMIQEGRLPPIKRRRARGITAGEFRGFRKVHKVLSGFCAPRMRIRRRK